MGSYKWFIFLAFALIISQHSTNCEDEGETEEGDGESDRGYKTATECQRAEDDPNYECSLKNGKWHKKKSSKRGTPNTFMQGNLMENDPNKVGSDKVKSEKFAMVASFARREIFESNKLFLVKEVKSKEGSDQDDDEEDDEEKGKDEEDEEQMTTMAPKKKKGKNPGLMGGMKTMGNVVNNTLSDMGNQTMTSLKKMKNMNGTMNIGGKKKKKMMTKKPEPEPEQEA